MPRTKRVAKVAESSKNVKFSMTTSNHDMINSYLKAVELEVKERELKYQNERKQMMLKLHTTLKEKCLKFSHSSGKTMAELKFEQPELETFFETTSFKNMTANTTKAGHKVNHSSRNEDSRNALLRSRTQSNIKKAKERRTSRSLSRSKLQQAALSTINSFNTPVNVGIPAATFGTVTPKMKPNIPQVVLRRPKNGEIAISMQGSPLMVSSIISDQKANVNIPLQDGRVLTIQPQRGLRPSQIPELDAETKRQIETLRDNLNKVCALTARR